jgi:signal transduction histidine kinase
MGSVARHDILNSLTVVLGFIRIAKQAPNAAARETAIDKIEAAANKIRRQIAFTKEYQNLGVKAPQWQGVSTLISKASPHGSMSAVQIIDETDSLFVFADPLFEKVFSTLIDNAVMHGGEQLTTIRFSWFKKDGDLIISCEDDGKGVPQENKSLIFERGFGTNAGPGLFLCREIILAITGMTIEETGQPGHGARFDIRVPEGKYRFNGSG